MVDMGLGFDADFSVAMLDRYGMRSMGLDPTQKHLDALDGVAGRSDGRFEVREAAIDAESGRVLFHESLENVSGSMMDGHVNVVSDATRSYEVDAVSIADALEWAGSDVQLVKMDIEGSEYGSLGAASDEVLRSVRQWCIEFHHDTVTGFDFGDTRRLIQRFEGLGFESFTTDSVNYLFFRKV